MPTKVLLINNGLFGGGTERASVSFSHYLVEQGYDVTLLALYQSEHFYQLDKRVRFIEPSFSREKISTYAYIWKMIRYVRQHVKQISPHTVLAYNEWTNAYVLLACLGLKTPIYVSERMHPKAALPKATEFLRKLLYPKAAGVVAQTAFGKKVIQQKTGAKNVIAIPNAVNVMEPMAVEKKKQVIAVGRLEPVKGHPFLIDAFAKISNNSWQLCIIGDGSQMSSLNQQAVDLNISDRVIFKGHQLDFRKELSESQIYVLPSVKEGFPNSLIEAMALPLACISGDFYEGEHDLVQDGVNGLLVPPCDTEALAQALKRLMENEQHRLGLAQEALKVRNDLAFNRVAEQLKEFIING